MSWMVLWSHPQKEQILLLINADWQRELRRRKTLFDGQADLLIVASERILGACWSLVRRVIFSIASSKLKVGGCLRVRTMRRGGNYAYQTFLNQTLKPEPRRLVDCTFLPRS